LETVAVVVHDNAYYIQHLKFFALVFNSLKLAKKEITKEEALEKLRSKLAPAMKRGETLVIAMTNNSPFFSTDLNSEAEFPAAEIFKGAGKGLVNDEWPQKLFRDADTADSAGLAICNPDFKVILTSNFEAGDIQEFLFDEGMGLSAFSPALFQVISIVAEE
jgi:hypothetical protein